METYADHTAALDNPIDAKTLRETTTRYDGRRRPIASTTWLVARGVVDQTTPPIAGLDGIAAAEGITSQYLYDDDLTDDVGLDSSTGGTPVLGGDAVSLAAAITKLAQPIANGGAATTFDADSTGSARVMINGAGDVRFTISAGGRSVISGSLDPTDNSLITWTCTGKPTTENITGYGTVLVSTSIDAAGNTRRSLTDAAGRTIQSHDALDKITLLTYDASGNQLSVRDPNGVGQDCSYDPLGRDISCTDTAGVATSQTYDLAGNKITSTDGKNETSTYEYDVLGRQTKQTDRLGGETLFAYTDLGQLESLTDAENQVTSYTYDDNGTKLTETYPDHTAGTSPGDVGYGIVTFTPDAAGRTIHKQDQAGNTVSYNYDLAGRMTSRDYRTLANSPAGAIADSDTFTYDSASRMLTATSGRYTNTVSYTYDDAGRKASESLQIAGQTYTTSMAYNDLGQVAQYTYPDGTGVTRTYTDRGQLATIARNAITIDTRTYDDGGRMQSSTYNNGVNETRAYNNDNTLASISFAGSDVGDLTYGWDDNKNKTSEDITGTMSGYGFNSTGYDNEDRLVSWNRTDNTLSKSWNLSLVGDWDSVTENGTQQDRTHGPTHEMLTAAGEAIITDTRGNMTSIPAALRPGDDPLNLTWDFDNRMSSADVDNDGTDDVSYQFDALGRRVANDNGTTTTVYVQSGQQTIADYTLGDTPASPTYTYYYASYIDEPVMRAGAGSLTYFHRNQQYSIVALTDSAGSIKERYSYTAYGSPTIFDGNGAVLTSSVENNHYTYTGREWDRDIKLYHFRARMYDAISGRFCSRDPIGYWDGLNQYEFVRSNPIREIDPFGLAASCAGSACTRSGPHGEFEGVWALFAEVSGSTCHGASSGCCNVFGGDAYLNLTYVEFHDTATVQRANEELDELAGRLRFGDIEQRGCTATYDSWQDKNNSWTIVAKISCPIKCAASCECEDPSASVGIYCSEHRNLHPTNPKNPPGLCYFFQRFDVSAQLDRKTQSCGFNGCSLKIGASWRAQPLQHQPWIFNGPYPKGTPCHEIVKLENTPMRKDFNSEAEYYRALESWYRCLGYRRRVIPWVSDCTPKDLSRAEGIAQ